MSYLRSPVQEAVVELRLKDPIPFDVAQKAAVRQRDKFPLSQPLRHFNFNVDLETGKATVKADGVGERRTSADAADIRMIQTTAFVAARLAPFGGWNTFSAAAQSDWEDWVKAVRPSSYSRLGVRFNNRIDIPDAVPGSPVLLNEYFRLWPSTEHDISPMMSGFVMTMQGVPLGDDLAKMTITMQPSPPMLVGFNSVTLDIDVWDDAAPPAAIWTRIDELGALNESTFERCITDRTRGILNE